MLFKLATRNMRRSVKDYAIYFVTLIVAVTIFYAFNSITDQHIMHEIEETNHVDLLLLMNIMMNTFSMVVAFVLGFLIIYANQLLVARRKMEFGIYFTLGMKPGHVSRILLYETVLVGFISLAIGLVLGILVSQLLSFVTAALFGVSMSQYQFDFSMNALLMTLVSFFFIYVVVAIFNVIMIHRCKLIDLINASKKSQKVTIRNPWLCLVLFVASIVIIGVSYYLFQQSGFLEMGTDNREFIASTILMLAGSLLFFFSLAGFLVAIITKSKNVYFRKLRPFTFRQLASKINTSFVSLWVVCVLLFLAITTFSTGMNLVTLFTGEIDAANPYDVSLSMVSKDGNYVAEQDPNERDSSSATTVESYLQQNIKDWNSLVEKSVQVDIYSLENVEYSTLFDEAGIEIVDNSLLGSMYDYPIEVVPLSQINNILEMLGRNSLDLQNGEYVILNNMSGLDDVVKKVLQKNIPISLPTGLLYPQKDALDIQLYDYSILSSSMIIVLPDNLIYGASENDYYPYLSIIDMNLWPGADENKLMEAIEDLKLSGESLLLSRNEMIDQAMGLRMMVTYLAIYIGLVLLIATAAVLAIQLLSLTIDSLSRYRILVKLGCQASSLKGSVFAQVFIFFCIPLVLAVCHCICAISVINGELTSFIKFGAMTTGIYIVILLVIYAIYMLVTYFASKSVIKEAWIRP